MKNKRAFLVWFLLSLLVMSVSVMSLTTMAESDEILPGDLNMDGCVNTSDIVLLRRHVAGGYGVELLQAVDISEDGYWIINGVTTSYRVDGNYEIMIDALQGILDYQTDQFVCEYEPAGIPAWTYTTSTFSGWGGSIGRPDYVDIIAIRVRARDTAITQIKFHLSVNDKNGEVLVSETVNVNIEPYEECEVFWDVPVKIEDNQDCLYLTYNCNALCDAYFSNSTAAQIASDQYQAIRSYTTNGRLHDSPASMADVSSKPTWYLYARLGRIKDIFTLNEHVFEDIYEPVNVFLPDEYALAVNDNFQLFYRGVVQAVDPYDYGISITCSKGKAYPRYFEWSPTEEEIGSYRLTLTVYDNNGKKVGSDTTTLKVYKPREDVPDQNILCIGDSLTGGGYWVSEMHRRFTAADGTPQGLGLDYLHCVGTVASSGVHHEGHSGWQWNTFCSEKSPFYDETLQDISFRSYCEKNNIEKLDVVYFLLTWNGQGTAYKTDFSTDQGHFVYARKLIDKLHEEYPDCIVRCMGLQMPSQNGGMGANYGAGGGYSDAYGMLVTAMHYNATLEALCKEEAYRDFVKYVDVAGQFDTDYNMPSKQKAVNNRSEQTETMGTNGVHPSLSGYYQIADAAFRSLCEVFAE